MPAILSFERYVDLLATPAVLFRKEVCRVRRQATLSLHEQRQVEFALLPPVTPADRHAFVSLQVIEPLPPLAQRPLQRWEEWWYRLRQQPLPMTMVELDDLYGRVHAIMLRDLEKERKYLEKAGGKKWRQPKSGKAESFNVGRWVAGLMGRFGGMPTQWEGIPRYLVEAVVQEANQLQDEEMVKRGVKPEPPVVADTPEKFFGALGLPVPAGVTPRPVEIDPDKVMPMAPQAMGKSESEDLDRRIEEKVNSMNRRPASRHRPDAPGTINRNIRRGLSGR